MPRSKRDAIAIVLDLQVAARHAYDALSITDRRIVDEVSRRMTPQPAKVQRTRRKIHVEPVKPRSAWSTDAAGTAPQSPLSVGMKAHMEIEEGRNRRLAELTNELNERAGREPGRAFTRTLLDRLYGREDLRPLIDELRTLYPKFQEKA